MNAVPECPNDNCVSKLILSNSARNFANSSLSVKLAVNKKMIKSKQKILDFGAGNLRNIFFISRHVNDTDLFVYENEATIQRFSEKYEFFKKNGGVILKNYINKQRYDAVICTFVLETLCPEAKRIFYLRSILASLKKKGILIASVRGYSGVIGSRYKKCPEKEGLISPLHTFIKPYSISSIRELLQSCGFKNILLFQEYRVDTPKNIHLVAFKENQNGKKMARNIL